MAMYAAEYLSRSPSVQPGNGCSYTPILKYENLIFISTRSVQVLPVVGDSSRSMRRLDKEVDNCPEARQEHLYEASIPYFVGKVERCGIADGKCLALVPVLLDYGLERIVRAGRLSSHDCSPRQSISKVQQK